MSAAAECSNQDAWERTGHPRDEKDGQTEDVYLKYNYQIVKNVCDNLNYQRID